MKRKIVILLVSVTLLGIMCSCSNKNKEPDIMEIQSICELATLECYYNNVAISEKEKGEGFAHLFEKDREFWIEYKGVAKIGVDMSQVKMTIKDENVTITIPPAKLLDMDKVADSYSYTLSKDGAINKNKITAKDQIKAVDKAQEEMEKQVNNNSKLLLTAQNRAKELIENYIDNMGKISGVEYKITWKELKE